MCLKSNPFKGAKATSWTNFALGAGESILGHSEKSREVDEINRARLLKFEVDRRNYHLDYRDRTLVWKNQNLDDSVALDEGYKESLGKLANNQLKVWQTIKQGTIAEQEAFAAMMSVGGGEQTGARSKSSISRREAVMAYGQRMNKIAAAKSSGKDSAALYASKVRDAFSDAAHKLDVKSGTSRPVYGAAPVFEGYKSKPSKWNMLLGIGRAGFDSLRMYDKLKAPESAAEGGGTIYDDLPDGPWGGPELELPPDIMQDIPTDWPEPPPDFEIPDIDGPVFKDLPVPKTEAKGDKLLGRRSQNIFLTTM